MELSHGSDWTWLGGDLLDDEYDGADGGFNMNTKVEALPHPNL